MAKNNIQLVLNALKEKYTFRFNLGNKKMEFHGIGESKFRDLTDIDLNSIRVELGLMGIACSKENLRSVIFSNQWQQYDPYKEFLEGLPLWDGQDHIHALAGTVKTDEPTYWEWCLRKWLVALVGALADEQTVNQTAIILCGTQGTGKSTWLKNILPVALRKYYDSGFMEPRDKESLVKLSELIVFNMDEVENLKPRYIEAVKELITRPSMYLRRAYTTLSQNYPRRCSFCGTANGTAILHDITGNRRFLCQNVLSVDYTLTGIDLYQVYAQAYQLYRTGFQFWLNAQEQVEVEKNNARFRAVSLEEELISAYYQPCQSGDAGTEMMQAHQIISDLQTKGYFGRLNPVAIGKVLSSKGFAQKKINGISKWVVRKRDTTQDV